MIDNSGKDLRVDANNPVIDEMDAESMNEKPGMSIRSRFLIGLVVGGFVSSVFLGFSMEMSQNSLAEVSSAQWGVVILVALICGLLGVKLGDKFFDALEDVSLLPF